MSRLTVLPPELARSARPAALGDINFRDMGSWFLATNDWGQHLMLSREDFQKVAEGRVNREEPLWSELQRKGFLREYLDFDALARLKLKKEAFQRQPGPSLHMLVVTLRCNQKCHYCHSSVVDPSRTDTDMDLETAQRAVDFIFSTPNPTLCLEFQGGEPLLNWPVVKFITKYAQAKAKLESRRLIVALVSNFTLMSEEKLDFLNERYVSLCTSLDGPAEVHDKNRPFLGGGQAQEKVVSWLKRIRARCEAVGDKRLYLPGALMTTTRFSFPHSRGIVDLYAELGLDQIFVRPLSPIGYAKRVWSDIGYAPQEFIEFYEKTLDYILELNRRGTPIMERTALIYLTKILKGEDPGFMDLRSPAGAVLGCLAYNYDGGIFVSDEGRMVAHQGDMIFKVGDVRDDWESVLSHPTTRACVASSILDNQPMCSQCAYKPYCGVCPVFHYETQHNVFGQMPSSAWCGAHMGLFDVIFRKLRDPQARAIFDRWMERDQCRWQESEAK